MIGASRRATGSGIRHARAGARIERCHDDIGRQVHEDDDDGQDQCRGLDDRVVTRVDGATMSCPSPGTP